MYPLADLGGDISLHTDCPEVLLEVHRVHPHQPLVTHGGDASSPSVEPLSDQLMGILVAADGHRHPVVRRFINRWGIGSLIVQAPDPDHRQQRSRGDDIHPAVVHQGLDGGACVRAQLYFIQEQERVAFNNPESAVSGAQGVQNTSRIQIPVEQSSGFDIVREVQP